MKGPLDPQAMSFSEGSMTRICRAASAALRPYSAATMCPICQGPSISLPRHQYFTLWGASYPCCRLRSLQRVPLSTLQYSTNAAAISAEPVPKFIPINGSVLASLHQVRNSLVPNWFVSSVFQARSRTRGRSLLGPTPSSQW